ncbi:pyridoxal phosphate homeostasis protein [Harpegnathos saltator]|uniref:Pyridoxal phosphate homeostasis protein n=1 Tax=Harpegnathos saltator TaxID=610380 RepID=E2BRJ7_HARSA|nr:pyridoxal phosphate homeostasis protein [Harpegnathos saltator]EFN81689.1 Proline synthetase co-transcribed bacterial-like protein protein [Harpegnathos saltator]
MAEAAANLKLVYEKILRAASKKASEHRYFEPRLVAVSKLQSVESILSVYKSGQTHFGENYVNELVEKASHPQILQYGTEIKWHFIGNLQRNKVNKILNVPNLYIIETVDNERLANMLNNLWVKFRKNDDTKLNIMVQINTSQEKEKNGCDMVEAPALVKHIINNCPNLKFIGLMTIGMFGYDIANGPNPDFINLLKCRETICNKLEIDFKNIELSMGMSNDYEHAIELGSTSVRVGSAIFGIRPQKNV